MDQQEQIAAFADELDRLVNHYGDEFDLSGAAVIGVMMMKIRLIQDDAIRRQDDPDEPAQIDWTSFFLGGTSSGSVSIRSAMSRAACSVPG